MKPSNSKNPKDIVGTDKLPLHLWPNTATALGCLAFLEGALKYGRSNFRAVGVQASIYYDALRRHIDAWFEGEDIDPDSGIPHLGKALACLAIIVDAIGAGKLNDDRMYPGGFLNQMRELTPVVAQLRERYKDKDPQHYNINGPFAENKYLDPDYVQVIRQTTEEMSDPNFSLPAPHAEIQTSELEAVAKELYFAGRWHTEGLDHVTAARLWGRLRDALGLPEGSARAVGLGCGENCECVANKTEPSAFDANGDYVGFTPQNKMGL